MFNLSRLEHTFRVPPDLLSRPIAEAIKGELEKLFLDKVIPNLGLCISVYDIRSIEGGFILPSEGAATYTVVFTMIMFRPFVGEIIGAKLKDSDANGLRLSLGFFYDIYVPANLLPQPSRHEPDPRKRGRVTWIWDYDGQDFVIDWQDEIRFQVRSVSYPPIPIEQPKESKPFAPMVITGSLDFDGSGPVSWWTDAVQVE
ncbi:RNA polymerase Rpb [Parasponia andersonii]|uniref:DNA-directed RNA polymerase subunit n=1 Tax=Parasponia andersonii TaxID=3476 RepID=A0A2P5AN82_PARAD|nr:RNA polymerase Rpb [Parasponia andersonii]